MVDALVAQASLALPGIHAKLRKFIFGEARSCYCAAASRAAGIFARAYAREGSRICKEAEKKAWNGAQPPEKPQNAAPRNLEMLGAAADAGFRLPSEYRSDATAAPGRLRCGPCDASPQS